MNPPWPPSGGPEGRQQDSQEQRKIFGLALLSGWLLFVLSAGVFTAAGLLDAAPPQASLETGSQTPAAIHTAAAQRAPRERLPVAVRIPAIGVEVSLVGLGLNDDGTLEVPTDFDTVGWYVHGPAPGEVGPAVLAGHVDSHSGPAAFFRLSEVRAGDEIFVDHDDGTTSRFLSERVERHPKEKFPTEEVYGDRAAPELRLVTCGGVFDRATGHYRDNVVVWAS